MNASNGKSEAVIIESLFTFFFSKRNNFLEYLVVFYKEKCHVQILFETPINMKRHRNRKRIFEGHCDKWLTRWQAGQQSRKAEQQ